MTKQRLLNLRKAIAEYEQKHGITQIELSRRTGVGDGTLRNIKKGSRGADAYPTLETLGTLADGMGTTVGALVGETSSDGHPVDEMLLMRSVVAVATKAHFEGDISATDLAAFITTAYTQRLADPSIGWDGETDRQIEADIRRQRLRDQFDG